MISLTTEQFIERAKQIHGDRYDYSRSVYQAGHPILIICRKHGEFYQKSGNHFGGKGCRLCKNEKLSKDRSFTTEDFIERAEKIHKSKYGYQFVKYVNAHTLVTIECPQHGLFEQHPLNHLKGCGCRKCGNLKLSAIFSSNIRDFILKANKIHKNRYEYGHVNYINAREKVTILCKKHGTFEQIPGKHLNGAGCPHCSESLGERRIREFLTSNKIEFKQEKTFAECRYKGRLFFDFYLPTLNTAIEFDGIQHFFPMSFSRRQNKDQNFRSCQERDKIKNDFCKENHIRLIRIPFTEINNIPNFLIKINLN
jgi:very-short-patch-repair endonuclease